MSSHHFSLSWLIWHHFSQFVCQRHQRLGWPWTKTLTTELISSSDIYLMQSRRLMVHQGRQRSKNEINKSKRALKSSEPQHKKIMIIIRIQWTKHRGNTRMKAIYLTQQHGSHREEVKEQTRRRRLTTHRWNTWDNHKRRAENEERTWQLRGKPTKWNTKQWT